MGGEAGEESFGSFAVEKLHEEFCRGKSCQTETCEQERMRGEYIQRAEDFSGENGPMFCEGLHQAAPTIAVLAENRFGGAQVALERYRCAVVKGMG
jgi:hypothetical protein